MKTSKILAATLASLGIILLIVVALQKTGNISVVPSDIIGILTILSLIATISGFILQVLLLINEPRLSFLSYREIPLHRAVEVEIIHSGGKFRLKLLVTGIKNIGGRFSKCAERCEVDLMMPDLIPRRLPFRVNKKVQVKVDHEVNAESAQEIVDALNSTLFLDREVDVKRDQTLQTIIGFFVETGRFYFATEDAIELPLSKGDMVLGATPFYLTAKGKNFSMTENSSRMVVGGNSWKDAQIGFVEKDEKISDNEYSSGTHFPEYIQLNQKAKRMLSDSIKTVTPIAESISSTTKFQLVKTKTLINGFVVKIRSYTGFSVRFSSATFPMTYIPKRKGIKKLLILKKADPILTNGEISKSFHVDVSANVNEANCGKMTDYLRCMEEQKAKKTSDIQGLSSKYNFPVDSLKEAIQSINKLNEKERHKKMVSKFKQEIIDYCKKNYHYPVDRDSIRVDIDPELTALSQLYL